MLPSENPLATAGGWLGALPPPQRGQRRVDLDALRGIAIVLVVVGHAVAREVPAGNEWYHHMKVLIYSFHMQLFMLLSGITFGMTVPAFATWAEARAYSWRKSSRLAALYLVFGVLILAGKIVAGPYLSVDKPPEDVGGDLLLLVVKPWLSAAGFLWFIYVLAAYMTIIPSLVWLLGRKPLPLFGAAIVLSLLPWPQWFMLDRIAGYLPFFCGGMMLCLRPHWWTPIPAAFGWLSAALFAVLLPTAKLVGVPGWFVAALSLPALLTLVQQVGEPPRRFWAMVGTYSLAIYLLNTILMGIAKGLMLKVHGWDGPAFLVFLPVLVFVGVAVPIVIKRLADRHAPALARIL